MSSEVEFECEEMSCGPSLLAYRFGQKDQDSFMKTFIIFKIKSGRLLRTTEEKHALKLHDLIYNLEWKTNKDNSVLEQIRGENSP